MKTKVSFWINQLKFAKANLDLLNYSKGRTTIDQKRLREFIKIHESQIERCKMAITAENLQTPLNPRDLPRATVVKRRQFERSSS